MADGGGCARGGSPARPGRERVAGPPSAPPAAGVGVAGGVAASPARGEWLRPVRGDDGAAAGNLPGGLRGRTDVARLHLPLQGERVGGGTPAGGAASAAPRLADVVRGVGVSSELAARPGAAAARGLARGGEALRPHAFRRAAAPLRARRAP